MHSIIKNHGGGGLKNILSYRAIQIIKVQFMNNDFIQMLLINYNVHIDV